ncbi:hypothetical protein PRZ48_006540 [Zasmidium cellare]|uniref:Pentatricopeptide repeat domain-containing protein n=1 Tax=Zasmidium cellare TaxID=395010 RepID=A0ABR0EPT7_ZASCE|nr:hypothetical protein PRZ48_006540 [Zasmidium cellare]
MGAPFAQWLGRPSTICFLRRLLASTGDSVPARSTTRKRCGGSGRNAHTATIRLHGGGVAKEVQEQEQEGEEEQNQKRSPVQRGGGMIAVHHGDALQMSLKAGVNLLDEGTTPEEALKRLWDQANVASPSKLGQLVVDHPEHRTNMKLWIELLEYRQRVDGLDGIVEVWKGMRSRQVDLPLSGAEADILWTTLLHACLAFQPNAVQLELQRSIMDHAKDLQQRYNAVWPKLYVCVVGRWLRVMPYLSWVSHKMFTNDFGISDYALGDLVEDCIASLKPGEARLKFHAIHRASGRTDLYDQSLPKLCKHIDDHEALLWHRLFIKLGDGPSPEIFALPSIQRLFELDADKSLPMHHHRSGADPRISAIPSDQQQPLTRANMSALVGEVHGIKAKEVSDTFVAKLFATRAFSLSLVIKGLSFFGIERLGPLALHEMALKAETYVAFSNGLSELKSMGIIIDTSVYGRLIEKVATDGHLHLFQVLMASDQHPEAYEDPQTQELLLVSFLERGDMLSAHLTLLALSLIGQTQHTRAWNRMLQHYIMERDYRAIDKTMRHMHDSKMPPTRTTLNIMNRNLLPPRNPGKAPSTYKSEMFILKPLQFTTNTYMFAAQNKVYVKPTLWKELLKRYAMAFKFDELERLVYWLLSWYGRNQSSRHLDLLHREATSAVQAGTTTYENCQPWARGLLLVMKLKDFGMDVSPRDIRRALTVRLLPLFGPGFSRKLINEEMRLRNHLTLADYIKHASEICQVNLFNVDTALLSEERPNPSRLMVQIFGDRRRIGGVKNKEYADIAGYAYANATGVAI